MFAYRNRTLTQQNEIKLYLVDVDDTLDISDVIDDIMQFIFILFSSLHVIVDQYNYVHACFSHN